MHDTPAGKLVERPKDISLGSTFSGRVVPLAQASPSICEEVVDEVESFLWGDWKPFPGQRRQALQ
jgi:hypothetical protein